MKCFPTPSALLLSAVLSLAAAPAMAGLANPRGLWQFNGNFAPAQAGFRAVNASTLTAGTDYSFAVDGAGYHYLQTQIFTPATKRLTVPSPNLTNGGVGASRTNQWTVVMDVKFDTVAPYAGFLQLDPANASDVTFYAQPGSQAGKAWVISGNAGVSADNALTLGAWHRLALTAGNNGAGGPLSIQCYVDGVPSGPAFASAFDGPLSLGNAWHLFTDDTAELRPAKLGFLGYWTETLSAADIARLGGPRPEGISPASLAYPGAPATWGTWRQNSYFGTPKQLSAATDPDGRLRLCYVDALNSLTGNSGTVHPAMMFTYRWPRPDAPAPQVEIRTISMGLTPSEPLSYTFGDNVTVAASRLRRRTKVVTADRNGGSFAVNATLTPRAPDESNSLILQSSRDYSEPSPNPYFPRRDWASGIGGSRMTASFHFGNFAHSIAISSNARGSIDGTLSTSPSIQLNIETPWGRHIGPITYPSSVLFDWRNDRTLQSMDLAATDDARDVYAAICSTRPLSGQTEAELRVFRYTKVATPSGTTIYTEGTSQWPQTELRSGAPEDVTYTYPKILLTRAGEPRWVVWADPTQSIVRIARRVPMIPDSDPETNEDRRIGGYNIVHRASLNSNFPYFALGYSLDAAMDSADRLHVVWQGVEGPSLVHYAREKADGTFDEITLPTSTTQPPCITIGPGDYPYIAWTGPNSSGNPLIVSVPPGLVTSYHGDFEDIDQDGRPALLELAQGTSDRFSESGSILNAVPMSASLATTSPGVRRFESTFKLAFQAVNESAATTWYLADGMDTLLIQPAYSLDGMATFQTDGFSKIDEFSFNGVRFATVRDTASTSTFPKQSYRIQVTRIPPTP
ncbi:MAG: hypothetical protein JWL81_1849 [Verrucomicrobiales bacterium]|nr:hypothetical protein [Verrucomicrobiales bacterium]